MKVHTFDIIVVGGGLVGFTFALDIAHKTPKLSIAIIDYKPVLALADGVLDSRIYAVSPHNVDYLKSLNAWPNEGGKVGTIDKMDVYGDSNGCIILDKRDSYQVFLSKTIESNYLQQAILAQLSELTNITFIYDELLSLDYLDNNKVKLGGANNNYISTLIVGADGANSFVRKAININAKQIGYPQHGIVANFECEKPHNNTARQWFNNGKILAYLPLPNNRISIVWSCSDHQELLDLDTYDFENLVASASGYELGKLTLINKPQIFPLSLYLLDKVYASNVVLIGDAAHTIHPLAGQGVNLGFSDARVLAYELSKLKSYQIADTVVLNRYSNKRVMLVRKMQLTCHALQGLFSNDNSFVKTVRNIGLNIFNRVTILKKYLISNAL